jgi:Tol biopolymer transport system component
MDVLKRLIVVLLVIVMVAPVALGQKLGGTTYGKNRIQYKDFDWFYYSTDNFDVYYYAGGKENAKIAIEYLESEFDRITDLVGYSPYAKTKIFLYNSINDLQQSNIGIDDQVFTIGGQTSFVKLQTEIAFPGTISEFKKELVLKIAEMLINDMMFGGSLADMFQSTYLMTLPEWFILGAARYAAEGWSVEMDDYLRDAINDKSFKKLNKFEGENAAILGQSVWNFIASRYGKSNISNVLNLTRIIRNEENSIASTLGVPFRQFLVNWQEFYKDGARRIADSYVDPNPENLFVKTKSNVKYNQIKLSPSGEKLLYSENLGGKYQVMVKDVNTGTQQKVLSGGYRLINQTIDYEMPLLQWIDDENIGVLQTIYGINYIVTYNIPTKTSVRKSLDRFENIKNITFNSNGKLAVISADVNGSNDLYLISMRRNAVRRLTNDQWDDITPQFLPEHDVILFSSNRMIDSVSQKNSDRKQVGDNFNIFMMDLDTTKTTFMRLTNTLSKDYLPKAKNDEELYYLSDQKGIFNLYRYNILDSTFNQISNFSSSIINYDINFTTGAFAFTMLQGGSEHIYLYKNFELNKSQFTPQTLKREIEQARLLKDRISSNNIAKLKEQAEEKKAESIAKKEETKPENADPNFIDTDNYVFKEEIEKKETEKSNFSFLSNYRKLEKKTSIVGPLPYDMRFSADNVITSFVIDPLRGFGMLLETSMNDLLGNHKFLGGIMAISDLKSGDLYGEYQFLKYRIDFKARYTRNVIMRRIDNEEILQKYVLDKFNFTASLPFTNALRFDISPQASTTRYLDLNRGGLRPTPLFNGNDKSVSYIGVDTEIVFDNSIVTGLNLLEGTRAKVGIKMNKSISDNSKSFSNFYLDARHYQKVHRDIIIASRLFYGKFYGNNNPNYMVGGMDNWLFNKTNSTGSNDPLLAASGVDNSNLLFNQFITNIRGFDYNTFNGTDAIVFNAELRFPAFRYFMHGPIASNFFRNFQLIGFYDVGSAWTGLSPFKSENDVNTRIIKNEESPFEAVLTNSSSPWLASYGAGIRTVFLGYYLKVDVARPIQDLAVGKPRVHLTLGYDF